MLTWWRSPKPSGETTRGNLAAFLKSFNNFLLHGQREPPSLNFARDGIYFAFQILLLWFLYLSWLVVTQDKVTLQPDEILKGKDDLPVFVSLSLSTCRVSLSSPQSSQRKWRCLKPSQRISLRSCHLVAGSLCCAASSPPPPPPHCCLRWSGDSRLQGASVVWSFTDSLSVRGYKDVEIVQTDPLWPSISIYGLSLQYSQPGSNVISAKP